MYLIVDTTTDPAWNLAAEEYLLTQRSDPFFRLWRNADSVIIGRHQNAYAEIDLDYVEREGIPVVRRMTGGGAVFHDLGNVNYSFFDLRGRRFTDVILEALAALGVTGSCSGRNDLVLEDGRKFSGTAVCKHGGRVLEHGTLLFDASFDRLSAALRPRPEKFSGKAVQSVRSRVANLSSQLAAPLSVEAFIAFLAQHIGDALGCTPYAFTAEDRAAIARLREERFGAPAWNFGTSPACRFTNVRKFPAGLVEVHFDIRGGRISGLRIFGDYFFTRPTEEFCALLEGCLYDRNAIAGRLLSVATGDYFSGIETEDLICIFFPSPIPGDPSACRRSH
ncbi:MAG: lipoate--protein ligase [Bacteroidales bacterium]|nr:lipoate--protein ligase [Bacteroidales bacterium]